MKVNSHAKNSKIKNNYTKFNGGTVPQSWGALGPEDWRHSTYPSSPF